MRPFSRSKVSLISNMLDRDIPSTANLYVLPESQEGVVGGQLKVYLFLIAWLGNMRSMSALLMTTV